MRSLRYLLHTLGILLLCCAVAANKEPLANAKYKDPKAPLEVRIKDLMSHMTFEEKIGQMIQMERTDATAEFITKYFIGRILNPQKVVKPTQILRYYKIMCAGSVLSGGGNVPAPNATSEAWVNMVNEIQTAALSIRLGIPMIYGIDAVHGHNNVYNATIFPHNIGLGVTRDPGLVKRIGAATALEVRATGIQYVFAPCIAVCRDPRWGRCYESYSEDHRIVQQMTEIIPGLQGDLPTSQKGVPFVAGKTKVAACAKHFVGDGGTLRGMNAYDTVINRKGLLGIHMPAYYDAVNKGVATVMVSYSLNGLKMHANLSRVSSRTSSSSRALSSRINYVSIRSPHLLVQTIHTLFTLLSLLDWIWSVGQVKRKLIPMSRIDDAVKRILRVKFTMGLFEDLIADHSLANQLGSKEHRELAREAVRKSLVLLKNGENADTPLLPLPKRTNKILVAGTHADNLGYQCGGWTITWQGLNGNNLTIGTTILSAVKNTVDPKTKVVYNQNPDVEFVKNGGFDYAIVVVGEIPYAEGFGDSKNLTISEPGPSTMLNVCASVKCVVVVISGRPVVMQPYMSNIDALVAAWLPGTEGQGVADVLFGNYGFTGKLARTWFKTVDQLPMNVGDPHYNPLNPFGFGLITNPF